MKFARYLEETQTPEWKKAYIDYRGIKKRITAISRSHLTSSASGSNEGLVMPQAAEHGPSSDNNVGPGAVRHPAETISPTSEFAAASPPSDIHDFERGQDEIRHLNLQPPVGEPEGLRSEPEYFTTAEPMTHSESQHTLRSVHTGPAAYRPARRGRSVINTNIFDRALRAASSAHGSGRPYKDVPRFDLRTAIPLMYLLPQLTPIERAFFEKLDAELDKVESFYCERERDMRRRVDVLKEQLQELNDHRRLFYEAHPGRAVHHPWLPVPLSINPVIPSILVHRRNARHDPSPSPSPPPAGTHRAPLLPPVAHVKQGGSANAGADESGPTQNTKFTEAGASRLKEQETENSQSAFGISRPGTPEKNATPVPKHYPEEYQHAKKQLKKAVLECYRGLELLNNYRTLNLIGFRKALKKFEKVTHIPAQVEYTKEKIEPSAFFSGATVDALIHDMEALFAARFARGDKKKAMARLRSGVQHTNHHYSTFRTGLALGLATPAFAAGLYDSFQADTRAAIPGWDGLLYVYAVLFVPTLFALIVGINLLVWSRARINYVFIFELDLRTRLDYRVYFEMPAFLLSLLCYAFWLSFARVGEGNVAPTTWPLLWLAFAAILILDPLPVMFKPSRWWLLKNISRLLTSGVHRVEFADFWMGDQFCSLIFPLSNLYYIGCIYSSGIDENWRRCTAGPGPRWGFTFLLASIPLLVRFVQSVKRWVDSGLITHLINGGKYGSGILQYLFYYLWRAQSGTYGPMFVLWCIFATYYSIYAGAWDLLMDWSLLRPHAPYPLLRAELLYSNNIPFYYFAIVTNTLIRFIWVIYIPAKGPNFVIRTFIAAMLEMLRRWQWNFLRLENEHLGNIDQYRVTREVPLPYSYEDHSHASGSDRDDDNDNDAKSHKKSSKRSWRMGRLSSQTDGTAAEVGPVSDH